LRRIFPALAFIVACIAASAVAAQSADPAKSTLTATFKQMGVPVDAPFKKFTATIDFDATKPTAGHAQIDIDVSSLDLGDPEYNGEIGKPEWFDAAHFPKASFVSTAIKATGPGKLEVSGTLSIKGKTNAVVVPLTYKQDAGGSSFDGSVPIKRLAFNIGEGEWKDTSTLADEVLVKFHVVVPPKK
jgi:polyisoprenoid-binding protein YceI